MRRHKENLPAPFQRAAFKNGAVLASEHALAAGGVYMKSIIAAALLVLLSSSLHAQARRRSSPVADASGYPLLDSPDLVSPGRSNLQSHPPASVQQRDNLVPVSQLRIPTKAIKEYDLAWKALQQHDVQASAGHLQKAVHIYPDFIQAHIALGLRFIQLGDYQKALAEQETALALDPRSAEAHQNLSFSLLLLNRIPEAEAEARESLDLDSQLVASRYLLGRALIAQGRATPEAMEMLRSSENAFPDASLVLAQLHFSAGQTDQVVADLRHYLRAPRDSDNKQKAECWVAQLSQQPSPAGCPAEATRPSFH
jgi:Tfp pilus assembly protein PilF